MLSIRLPPLGGLSCNENEEDNREIVMTSLQSMIEEREANAAKKARIEGQAKGEAKSIVKSFKLSESDQDMLDEYTTLTSDKLSKIKQLPQPPKSEDIFKILLDDLTTQDLPVELSGVSDTQYTVDEE